MNDWDIIRRRQAGHADRLGRRRRGAAPGSEARVVSVFDAGSKPTTVPSYFATHFADAVGGDDGEGQPGSFAFNKSSVPVLVLGSVPVVGDRLIADRIGGRWVAERLNPAAVGTGVLCGGCELPASVSLAVSIPASYVKSDTFNYSPDWPLAYPQFSFGDIIAPVFIGGAVTGWYSTALHTVVSPPFGIGCEGGVLAASTSVNYYQYLLPCPFRLSLIGATAVDQAILCCVLGGGFHCGTNFTPGLTWPQPVPCADHAVEDALEFPDTGFFVLSW